MPEYLAPGVFVEETSFRPKTIEGVSTSTAAFVGPTRFGPILDRPELLTSFSDFERIYGGLDPLELDDLQSTPNDLAQAVRAFFEEGGRRLYVARIFNDRGGEGAEPRFEDGRWTDGLARWRSDSSPAPRVSVRARHPGRCGNFTARLLFRLGENIRSAESVDADDSSDPTSPLLMGVQEHDVVLARSIASPPSDYQVYWIERFFDESRQQDRFRLRQDDPGPPSGSSIPLDELDEVRVLTVGIRTSPIGRFCKEKTWEGLTFNPEHLRSLARFFGAQPADRSLELECPLVIDTDLENGAAIAAELLAHGNAAGTGTVFESLLSAEASDSMRTLELELSGGNDGRQPRAGHYEGDQGETNGPAKSGLRAFEDLEDISIVAAPGSTRDFAALGGTNDQAVPIMRLLIGHCEGLRFRTAVLDSIEGQTPTEVRALREEIDTTHAALYYPWVRIHDPFTDREILQPSSGFVCGIYARNDSERGVQKAPANEVIRLAVGLESELTRAHQEELNPLGINCLRFFEGRGYRVWGARTATSDPEWKYINLRRYFAYLESSIEKGTQFAVFEPNGEALWATIRRAVEEFLFKEWRAGHLMGSKPDEAFFVRCDRSTMTQNDLDNGRLLCLIGVAPLRPAEFMIFRFGQRTAESRS